MRYFITVAAILLSVSWAYSTPMMPDECSTIKCHEVIEIQRVERHSTQQVERNERVETSTTTQVERTERREGWLEVRTEERRENRENRGERRENRQSNIDRFWYSNGTCRISMISEDHQSEHARWSVNPQVIYNTASNGVTTYEINDVDECGIIRQRTEASRLGNNGNSGSRGSSSSSGSNNASSIWMHWIEEYSWMETMTISSWVNTSTIETVTNSWWEDVEISTIVCEIIPNNPVPEPATMFLFGSGLILLATTSRKLKYKRE